MKRWLQGSRSHHIPVLVVNPGEDYFMILFTDIYRLVLSPRVIHICGYIQCLRDIVMHPDIFVQRMLIAANDKQEMLILISATMASLTKSD